MTKRILIGAASLAVVTLLAAWVFVGWRAKGYEAVSLIRIHRAGAASETVQAESAADYDVFKNTHAALIRSPFICNAALRQPGIASLPWVRKQKDAASALAGALDVRTPKGTEILAVSLRGPNKDDTSKLLDAVVSAYVDEIVDEEHKRQVREIEELRDRSRGTREQIKEKLEELGELEQGDAELGDLQWHQRRIDSLDDRLLDLEIAIAQAGQDEEQLSKLNVAKEVVTEKLDQVRSRKSRQSSEVELRRIELANLQETLAKIEAEISARRLSSNPRIEVLQRAHVPGSGLALW